MRQMTDLLSRDSAIRFTRTILSEARAVGLPLESKSVDHLCFRVEHVDDYRFACNLIASGTAHDLRGTLLAESMVNGRPISAFKLHESLIVDDQVVSVIEIPSPKQGRHYATGFEHIEVVTAMSFAELRQRFQHLTFEGPASDNSFNPELVWRASRGTVKFHHQTLEHVIELERSQAQSYDPLS
jgi:predicted metalloenzyme YecM